LSYQDKINGPFMYVLGAVVAVFVIAQSLVFLVRAWKQGLKIGISRQKLWGTVRSSALFSIVPSIPIVIAVFTMSRALGVPLPWIRLSVVGAVTYELPVAEQAATAMGMAKGLADPNFNMSVFAGVALVMSIGIIWGLLLCLFGGLEFLNKRMDKMQDTDRKWGEIFVTSLFMGLVATFCGYIITPPIVQAIRDLAAGKDGLGCGICRHIDSAYFRAFDVCDYKDIRKKRENKVAGFFCSSYFNDYFDGNGNCVHYYAGG